MQKGVTYRYKYRARNVNGWGEFSDITYLIAASKPEIPPAPALISVDAGEITLSFTPPQDTGGAVVTLYELFVDDGEINTSFTKVSTYLGTSLSH